MRAYTMNELFRLTRTQLLALRAKIVAEFCTLPEGSVEHAVAYGNLYRIQRVLAHPRFAP